MLSSVQHDCLWHCKASIRTNGVAFKNPCYTEKHIGEWSTVLVKLSYSSLSTSGVLGLLQKLKLRNLCVVTCLKTRQSQMVREKQGALQEADSLLYVTGFASCVSCHDNHWHS